MEGRKQVGSSSSISSELFGFKLVFIVIVDRDFWFKKDGGDDIQMEIVLQEEIGGKGHSITKALPPRHVNSPCSLCSMKDRCHYS
ncbi:hypothetical protein HHK36_013618 [Tetracentron sinense]|uniref:Uncharacterized protein n=1 Tax=Tetracentron sinense TaxID=13715 RepID=A0A835DEL3_TETSI|nr:hypothetical protein HHK36_013618 [Tetracentron sinense]